MKDTNVLYKYTNLRPELGNLDPQRTYASSNEAQSVWDSWHNEYASINCNNSLIDFTKFTSTRLTYSQCETLSEDSTCNQAINTLSKDIIGNRGTFILLDKVSDPQGIISKLEDRLRELRFWEVLKFAIEDTLVYGGCLLFIKTGRATHELPAAFTYEGFTGSNAISKLVTLSPVQVSPAGVNVQDPTDEYYMKPQSWRLKSGNVHSSFTIPIVMFHCRLNRLPLYNYFGISLLQFMNDSVRNFESIQGTIHDMCLRMRTSIIKTTQPDITTEQLADRIKYINQTANNYSTILLNQHEDYQQITTSISGMERLISQAQQSIATAARMPAVKLLGLSPQGLNNTGEFDMKNYYDHIESYQKSIFVSIVEKVAQVTLWGLGYNLKLKFEFTPIAQESYMEREQRNNVTVGYVNSMLNMGVLDDYGAFQYLRAANILDDSYDFPDEEDTSEYENEPPQPEEQVPTNEVPQPENIKNLKNETKVNENPLTSKQN